MKEILSAVRCCDESEAFFRDQRLIVPFIDVPSLSLRFLTLFELRDSRDGSFPELRRL
jgi:hypothetical protein